MAEFAAGEVGAATVPARSAHAFMAHPTRFERVTVAFWALLLPNQPLQGRLLDTSPMLSLQE
jgi:hypothetical protein